MVGIRKEPDWFGIGSDSESDDEISEGERNPALTDSFSDEYSPQEQNAAALLQRIGRGIKTRREMVLPSQLADKLKLALEQAGVDNKHVNRLSKTLAREILNSSNDPGFEDHGKRLYKNKNIPADIWINRTGNHVEIEIIGKEFAHGTVKTLHNSSILTVDLSTPQHEQSTTPITTVKFPEEEPDDDDFFQQAVGDGQELVRQSFTPEEIKRFKIAGVLDKIDRINSNGVREARDRLYENDLAQQISQLSDAQKKNILSDIAKALTAFHERGLVHGDVKPENMFLSQKGTSGHLGDPDTTAELGTQAVGDTLGRIDAINDKLQLATPFTDIFALATCCEDAFKQHNPYQKEIDDVKSTNKQIYTLLESEDEDFMSLLDELQSDDPDEKDAAMEELHNQFPAFNTLLQKVATHTNPSTGL